MIIAGSIAACGEPQQESAWSYHEEMDLMTDRPKRTAISRSVAGVKAELMFSCEWYDLDDDEEFDSGYGINAVITWPEDMHKNEYEWDMDGVTVLYRLGNSEPVEQKDSFSDNRRMLYLYSVIDSPTLNDLLSGNEVYGSLSVKVERDHGDFGDSLPLEARWSLIGLDDAVSPIAALCHEEVQ